MRLQGRGVERGKKEFSPVHTLTFSRIKMKEKKKKKNRNAPDSSHAKKGEKHIEIEREGGAFSDAYFPANAVLEKKIKKM